jgi:hypothetical protein
MRPVLLFTAISLTLWLATARPLWANPPDHRFGTSTVDAVLVSADTAGGSSASQDSTLEVPWNGTLWQSMPNFTWAACDVSRNTRRAIDLAIGQWSYAAANQGIPIHLSEMPCTNGNTQAQIRIFEASATDLPGAPDRDVFGLTEAMDARGRICVIEVPAPCVAQNAGIFLFSDNWEVNSLTYAQAAKTIAHEIGHAIGLGHAHFCNFDSLMAQSCEPILSGLGPDDIQSIDALVDMVRSSFNLQPVNAQPPAQAVSTSNTVTYRAGYNLVAGPRGTSFAAAANPLYTLLPGDTNYRALPSSQPSYNAYGYWAYFAQDTNVPLAGSGPPFFTAVGSPGQWFLVGNQSGTSPMRVVLGSQSVYLYDAQAKQYKTSDTIPAGQAAWVRANRDGFIAVAATSLTRDLVNCYLNLGSPSSC